MEKKLVGAHIDRADAHRIALLSLEQGIPRSAILLQIFTDFLKDKPTLDTMVKTAVKRAVRGWKEAKQSKESYMQVIREDLTSHRIDKEVIDQIISGVKTKI